MQGCQCLYSAASTWAVAIVEMVVHSPWGGTDRAAAAVVFASLAAYCTETAASGGEKLRRLL